MIEKKQIAAVVGRLRSFHAENRQEHLGDTLRGWMEDPLRPRTEKGKLRINPLLLLLALMALLAVGTFLFFGLVHS